MNPPHDIQVSVLRWAPPIVHGLVRDLRVRWALEEAGWPYREHLVSRDDQAGPAYRELQPFGQVPAFQSDELKTFESGAIVLHIAERSATLMPEEPAARAQVTAWIFGALNSVEPPAMMLTDSNTVPNDGCSATCTVEAGFTCNGFSPTLCTAICGDGLRKPSETCDDGNLSNGDGCSSVCRVEPGYICFGNGPSVCSAGCGDGIRAGAEECDDGNNVDGDGCFSYCFQEPGWTCVGQGPGSCTMN